MRIAVNNGLALPNGDWLIPFHYDRSGQTGAFDTKRADYVGAVAISSDQGATWHRHGEIQVRNQSHSPNAASWAVEPTVFQLRNGVLRMILRTRNGHLYQSTSCDRGLTWSGALKMTLSNCDTKANALVLHDGHIALFWNDTGVLDFSRPYPLIATLSTDGGTTWFRSLPMEDDHVTLDYPTAVQIGDAIKAVYGYNLQQIRLLSLNEEDFRRWTPINNSAAWTVQHGVLRFAGGTEPQDSLDCLRWSKLVAFLPTKPPQFSFMIDLRFDDAPSRDAAIGIFPGYRDESNWSGWVWEPAAGKAGLQQEIHSGSEARPFYTRNISNSYFENIPLPQENRWYRLGLTLGRDTIEYQLADREAGAILFSGRNKVAVRGEFIAVGARKLACISHQRIAKQGEWI